MFRQCHAGRLAKEQTWVAWPAERRSLSKHELHAAPPPPQCHKVAPPPSPCQGVYGDEGVSVVRGLCWAKRAGTRRLRVPLARWRLRELERGNISSQSRSRPQIMRAPPSQPTPAPHTSLHLFDRCIWLVEAWEVAGRACFWLSTTASNCTLSNLLT